MPTTTPRLGLKKPLGNETVSRDSYNENLEIIESNVAKKVDLDSHLADYAKFEWAGGTGNAITLTKATLVDLHSANFICTANNGGSATTINGKPLYKPATTSAPILITGKAYTVWYFAPNTCFFIKASATGTSVAANVLAGKTFSNDNDTDLVGTIPSMISGRPLSTQVGFWETGGSIYARMPNDVFLTGDDNFLKLTDTNFIASNLLEGKSYFGLAGTATVESLGGVKDATGTIPNTTVGYNILNTRYTVTGLTFKPRIITIKFACLDINSGVSNTSLTSAYCYERSLNISADMIYIESINDNGFTVRFIPYSTDYLGATFSNIIWEAIK